MPAKRTFEYSVNRLHSTVLECDAMTMAGKKLWNELDWKCVQRNNGQDNFYTSEAEYLIVRVKHDRVSDVPRFYPIRCKYRIGLALRGGIVVDVEVEKIRCRWTWTVYVKLENQKGE